MDVIELEDIVDNMILQLSYPGLDVRTLNISLPAIVCEAPTKVFVEALKSKNVNVNLVALRWFQNKLGAAKHHANSIAALLQNEDSWIRKETIKTLHSTKTADDKIVLNICQLLEDNEQIVRMEAAKFLGGLGKDFNQIKSSNKNLDVQDSLKAKVITSLQKASEDPIQEVRRKAVKALRKIGAFSTS